MIPPSRSLSLPATNPIQEEFNMGQPFLALITPLTGGDLPYPDQGLPGGQPPRPTHPIAPGGRPPGIWGPTDPRPDQGLPGSQPGIDNTLPPNVELPIVLPPVDGGGEGGQPSHPIVIPPGSPGYPSHPIYRPPGSAKPEHPIELPPAPPEGTKPPPEDGGWGYFEEYGWGYFPAQGEEATPKAAGQQQQQPRQRRR
jgi:hypothetical protein